MVSVGRRAQPEDEESALEGEEDVEVDVSEGAGGAVSWLRRLAEVRLPCRPVVLFLLLDGVETAKRSAENGDEQTRQAEAVMAIGMLGVGRMMVLGQLNFTCLVT